MIMNICKKVYLILELKLNEGIPLFVRRTVHTLTILSIAK
jgi:hypothetical protein